MNENKKQNMQKPEKNELLEPLRKMNLMDDFLFDVTTVNIEACRIIIELSLGIRIKEIRWKEGQKVVHNLPGKRGIRMDFYVEDAQNRIFDVEMQKRNRGNIPKRTRYYQALLDAPLLKSGEEGFDNLKPTYIVVICGFDQYHQGKYRYTFRSVCSEVPGLELGDECTKIILNTKGKNDSEVERPLVDFLHYVENSSAAGISEDCDERLVHLHTIVEKIKASEQMGVTYMKMQERDRQIREDGREAGRREGERAKLLSLVQKKLEKGKTVEQIAEDLEEEISVINGLVKHLEEEGGAGV